MRRAGDVLGLERNRREVVRVQRELCYAWIAQGAMSKRHRVLSADDRRRYR